MAAIRKLLLDDEIGLISRLENMLNDEDFQKDFQLVSKEQSCINFSLGEARTRLQCDTNAILIVGQSIELDVQIAIASLDCTELKMKAAEFQTVVDAQILWWYRSNKLETKLLNRISEIEGSVSHKGTTVENNPYLPPNAVEITAKCKFEFQYFR